MQSYKRVQSRAAKAEGEIDDIEEQANAKKKNPFWYLN